MRSIAHEGAASGPSEEASAEAAFAETRRLGQAGSITLRYASGMAERCIEPVTADAWRVAVAIILDVCVSRQ